MSNTMVALNSLEVESSTSINGALEKLKATSDQYNTGVQWLCARITIHAAKYGDYSGAERMCNMMRGGAHKKVVAWFSSQSILDPVKGNKEGKVSFTLNKARRDDLNHLLDTQGENVVGSHLMDNKPWFKAAVPKVKEETAYDLIAKVKALIASVDKKVFAEKNPLVLSDVDRKVLTALRLATAE